MHGGCEQHIISINKITLKLVETFMGSMEIFFALQRGWNGNLKLTFSIAAPMDVWSGATLKYMFYGKQHRTTIDISLYFSASIYVIEIQMQPKDGRTKLCSPIEHIFYLISCLVN